MCDYKNGKIYKLESKEGNVRYYGSTTQTLKERLRIHKKNNNTTSRDILKYDDCKIILIENYPCSSKKELETRERFYIENNECVNKYIPTRTRKEWREENKDENKQEISEKRKEKITCPCGSVVRKYSIRRHEKSIKHQQWLKNNS